MGYMIGEWRWVKDNLVQVEGNGDFEGNIKDWHGL